MAESLEWVGNYAGVGFLTVEMRVKHHLFVGHRCNSFLYALTTFIMPLQPALAPLEVDFALAGG